MTTGLQQRSGIAVIAVTRGGASLGAELVAALGPSAELYVQERRANDLPTRAQIFRGGVASLLGELFPRVEGLVLILALGATVRLIAPLLSNKEDDPGVVATDEVGRFAISVVGGHRGGANELAERVGAALDATPVVTTASENHGLPAIDTLGREHGWVLDASREALLQVSAAAVNGEPVALFQDAGDRGWQAAVPPAWPRCKCLAEVAAWSGPAILVTDALLDDQAPVRRAGWVVYRPKSLVLGIGCSTGAPAEEMELLSRRVMRDAGLSWDSVRSIATIDRRVGEPGVRRFAEALGVPLHFYTAAELSQVPGLPTPSDEVARHVGTAGVCEPAALLGSEGGMLVVPKQKSKSATVAIARLPDTQARPSGCLVLVSLGPGPLELMTSRARRALRTADVIVGYRGYLEPLASALPGRDFHSYELGQEAERAQDSIDMARGGHRVALVSSGDVGVYAMAGLALELLGDEDEATRPGIEVIPGVTAATAAAALLGAPLMLDFAAISLSDLLVPWHQIERRLFGAASGDLVVVLYNPASTRRRSQLSRAAEILLAHRPASTPIGVVRDAYRPEQSVRVIPLGELSEARIDMKTIVIVGNSMTVRLGNRLVTRRGYRADDTASAETPRRV